jgi:hypothetical protein
LRFEEVNTMPQQTPEEAVNAYLMEHHEVCLEEVLAEAVEGNVRPVLKASLEVTATCLDRVRDEDGAVAELYEGMLTLQGVQYAWRASFYTDVDGGRFVADLGEFKPVDWKAAVRLAQ